MNETRHLITRRRAALYGLAAVLSPRALLMGESASVVSSRLEAIEKKSKGRLGCSILDTGTGRQAGHRSSELFPMCSTFKFLAAAYVLHRVDRSQERLERKISYSSADLTSYSPVTGPHAGDGMTVADLCSAAITMSDNTAANLLLGSFGGPSGLTAFLRSIGDPVTRLDRTEGTLNEAIPGDPRDTTTPSAVLEDMRRILLGDVLSAQSRALITQWMVGCKTGDARLRAGLPRGWKTGDKTGSGENGTTNDIAIIWPPGRAPVLVAAYLTTSSLSGDDRSAILADVGRVVLSILEPA